MLAFLSKDLLLFKDVLKLLGAALIATCKKLQVEPLQYSLGQVSFWVSASIRWVISPKVCVERERRCAVEQRARQMLRPKASKCAACADADWVYGGLCRAHQEELETLCEAL